MRITKWFQTNVILAIVVTAVLSTALASADDRWVVYEGKEGPGKGKHIVLIAGDEEYRSEEAMPQLGKILAVHHGFKCTVLFSQNPKTGEIKEWPSPRGPESHPYAFAVVDDVIWYNESGMRPDALVRFDPETEQFQSWAIPSGAGIIRNMWVTEAGDLLIHQSSSNRVGLVEIGK